MLDNEKLRRQIRDLRAALAPFARVTDVESRLCETPGKTWQVQHNGEPLIPADFKAAKRVYEETER